MPRLRFLRPSTGLGLEKRGIHSPIWPFIGRFYYLRLFAWLLPALISASLNLLSNKLKQPHNVLLSQIYRILEENGDIVLEDNRLQVIEEYNLAECSILTAIFYNEIIRDRFQKIVDFNLAPENRGW